MIFGARHIDNYLMKQQWLAKEFKRPTIERRFCFIPRELEDGRIVWLEFVLRELDIRDNGGYYSLGPDVYIYRSIDVCCPTRKYKEDT